MNALRQRFYGVMPAAAERTGRFAGVLNLLRTIRLRGIRRTLSSSSLLVQILILIGTWLAVALIIVPVLTAIFE